MSVSWMLYRKRVFQPLGMTDTDFYVPEEKRSRLAQLWHQYVWDGSRGGLVVEPDPASGHDGLPEKAGVFLCGAGLVSTLPDYLQFAAMLAGRAASCKRRAAPSVKTPGRCCR